jgi:hypothetical protein
MIHTLRDIQAEDGRLHFRTEEIGGSAGGVYFLRFRTSSKASQGKLILVE